MSQGELRVKRNTVELENPRIRDFENKLNFIAEKAWIANVH